jgi:hypothetical protein
LAVGAATKAALTIQHVCRFLRVQPRLQAIRSSLMAGGRKQMHVSAHVQSSGLVLPLRLTAFSKIHTIYIYIYIWKRRRKNERDGERAGKRKETVRELEQYGAK